jgi:hypothetical protein
MRSRGLLLLTLLLLACIASPAGAQVLCSEPRKPICLDLNPSFNSETDFSLCRMEVEMFVKGNKEYVACLHAEIEAAAARTKKMIERFNCRARNESFCL